jgi:hypothetical protein
VPRNGHEKQELKKLVQDTGKHLAKSLLRTLFENFTKGAVNDKEERVLLDMLELALVLCAQVRNKVRRLLKELSNDDGRDDAQ